MRRPAALALAASVAVAASLASAGRAAAQVPIIDGAAEGNTADFIVQVQAEVQKLSALASTVSSVLNVQHDISVALGFIGAGATDTGGGSLGQLIASAQMGFQDVMGARNTAEQLIGEVRNLASDPLGSLSVLTVMNIIAQDSGLQINLGALGQGVDMTSINQMLGGSMSAPNAITAIETTLFTPSGTATTDQVEAVSRARRAMAQNAAVQGVAGASSGTQTYKLPADALLALTTGVANSQDERGDVKANSAVLLKILEQSIAGTGLLGKIVMVHSSVTIIDQPQYGPNAGTAVP